MKKQIFTILSSALCLISYGQNVGIKTVTPKQTLDINGTLRIKDVEVNNNLTDKTIKPLGWITLNSANNDGKLVELIDNDFSDKKKAFQIYHIKIPTQSNSQDFIKNYNMGINAKKYSLMVLGANLKDDEGKPLYMQVLWKPNNDTKYYPLNSGRDSDQRGHLRYWKDVKYQAATRSSNLNEGETNADDGLVSIPARILGFYKNNNTWIFYADYPTSRPIVFRYDSNHYSTYDKRISTRAHQESPIEVESNCYWYVTLMVIDNHFAEYRNVTINEGHTYNDPVVGTKN